MAARRGHNVTLVEKNENLGGLIRAAAVPPMKWEIASVITSLAHEAGNSGVNIVLNKEADAEFVTQRSPDIVILATGSVPQIPRIPGVNSKSVKTAVDILLGKEWVGKKVAIIGGGMVGCETADFLSEYKREITIYEMLDKICSDVWMGIKSRMQVRLSSNGIKINTSSVVTNIEGGVITYMKNNQSFKSEQYDDILIAIGMHSMATLKRTIKKSGIEVKVIGDAVNPTRLHEALTSAVEAVIKI